jgi:hypothetical protein
LGDSPSTPVATKRDPIEEVLNKTKDLMTSQKNLTAKLDGHWKFSMSDTPYFEGDQTSIPNDRDTMDAVESRAHASCHDVASGSDLWYDAFESLKAFIMRKIFKDTSKSYRRWTPADAGSLHFSR